MTPTRDTALRTTAPKTTPITRFLAWVDALPPARRHQALVANLVAQIGIILTGGVVRLTSSGLGCDTWPMCHPGAFTPIRHEAATYHDAIEFGNRMLTGVLVVLAIGAGLVVWRQRDRAIAFRRLGWAPLAGVIAQAIIGGVVVLLDLHPAFVGLHMLVSVALVWVSTVLVYRNREGDAPALATVDLLTRRLAWVLGAVCVPVVVLGIVTTGSGPHGGDDDVPYRFGFDPVVVTRAHALCVWLFVAVLALYVYRVIRYRAPAGVQSAAWTLAAVTVVQGAIGYTQYFTGLPIAVVAAHMLGAGLLVTAVTWMVLTTRTRERVPQGA